MTSHASTTNRDHEGHNHEDDKAKIVTALSPDCYSAPPSLRLTSLLPSIPPHVTNPQLTKDKFEVVLKMVELKTTTKGERAPRAKPTASMSLKLVDLVSIKATDVGMSDLAVGPSRTTADGFTDGGISRGERFERELVAWAPAEGDAADGVGLLEDPTMRSNKNGGKGSSWAGNSSAAGWDQFAANKSKFNVDTTFDENLYTTAIDKNASGGISEAEAARIAREIMSQDSSNIHVQEERGLRVTADYDEEDRYGAVMGTGAAAGGTHRAKAVPKAPAWGGSGAGVTAITGKVAPPPKPNSPPPPKTKLDEKKPGSDGEKPKSTLNPNAKSFTLSAKAAAFTPSFAPKKPVAPAVPPTGYPGMMPGMMPGFPMPGMPGLPGMPGMPPNMMYGAPTHFGRAPPNMGGGRGQGGRGGRGGYGQVPGGPRPPMDPQHAAMIASAAAQAAHASAHAAASAGVPAPPPVAPAPPPADSA